MSWNVRSAALKIEACASGETTALRDAWQETVSAARRMTMRQREKIRSDLFLQCKIKSDLIFDLIFGQAVLFRVSVFKPASLFLPYRILSILAKVKRQSKK